MRPGEPGLGADAGDRIGRALLAFVAGAMALLSVLLWFALAPQPAYYAPLGLLLLAAGCSFLRGRRRAKAALLLFVLSPSPWLVNAALKWQAQRAAAAVLQAKKDYAKNAGIPFDARSPTQIVEELRAAGRDIWPAVYPGPLLRLRPRGLIAQNGERLVPLAGIANVDTRYGNEEGRYLIYHADEHGFHNPQGIWDLPGIDVAVLGDSYAHGAQVPSDRNLAALIRRRWPATLNLGYGGNGPLIELAALLEYLPQRRPRAVLWVLCERNDLGEDLSWEMKVPLLQRYWKERRKIQNLESRQPEIDALLREYSERARVSAQNSRPPSLHWSLATLEQLRLNAQTGNPPMDRWDVFTEILRAARDEVRAWQGTFYLVYLPLHRGQRESRLTQLQRGKPAERRERALEIGRVLDIPVIDVETAFERAGARVETFYYPYPAHFTAAGYEEAGRAIVHRLEADGLH